MAPAPVPVVPRLQAALKATGIPSGPNDTQAASAPAGCVNEDPVDQVPPPGSEGACGGPAGGAGVTPQFTPGTACSASRCSPASRQQSAAPPLLSSKTSTGTGRPWSFTIGFPHASFGFVGSTANTTTWRLPVASARDRAKEKALATVRAAARSCRLAW